MGVFVYDLYPLDMISATLAFTHIQITHDITSIHMYIYDHEYMAQHYNMCLDNTFHCTPSGHAKNQLIQKTHTSMYFC